MKRSPSAGEESKRGFFVQAGERIKSIFTKNDDGDEMSESPTKDRKAGKSSVSPGSKSEKKKKKTKP